MIKPFSDAEKIAWLKNQPKKVVSSKVILRDQAEKVLVLKVTYKEGWDFPGGIADELESPLRAAVRETHEEVGLQLELKRLKFIGVRYGRSQRTDRDFLHFFYTVQLSDDERTALTLDNYEVADSRWIKPEQVATHVTGHIGTFAHRLLNGGKDQYSDSDEIFV